MLDGQTAAQDKPFKVDGYEIMYPGDSSAPGYLVYNCRCTVIAEVEGVDTSGAQRRARNPETGRNELISDMTYAEWAGWKAADGMQRDISRQLNSYAPIRQNTIENAEENGIIKLSNVEVRQWYIEQVSKIPNSIDQALPMEEQARQAFDARNRIRAKARAMMKDESARKRLDSERPNKTFEELIESKMKRKGMSREEAIADILKTTTKTNRDVNNKLGLDGD